MPRENHLLGPVRPELAEAGCDEAGRGPLAGPVFAAAVILPADFRHPLLNDSKKMGRKARELLRETIERGRFIRPDTSEIEVRAVIDTPKGQVTSPADYYDITHIKTTNEAGARQDVIGYGERVVLPATQVNRKDAVTVFGIDVKELTALRACTVGGKIALVNGKIMTIRIPKE